MEKNFVYPGSFDPFTTGHYDVLKRAFRKFGPGVVVVGNNEEKSVLNKTLFSLEKKTVLIKAALKEYSEADVCLTATERRRLPETEVVAFEGLQVDAAIKLGCPVIVRGVRNNCDRELEEKLKCFNDELAGIRAARVETVLFAAEGKLCFVSSTDTKELCRIGEYILARKFVAPVIHNEMMKIYLQPVYESILNKFGIANCKKQWADLVANLAFGAKNSFSTIGCRLNRLAIRERNGGEREDNKLLRLAIFYDEADLSAVAEGDFAKFLLPPEKQVALRQEIEQLDRFEKCRENGLCLAAG